MLAGWLAGWLLAGWLGCVWCVFVVVGRAPVAKASVVGPPPTVVNVAVPVLSVCSATQSGKMIFQTISPSIPWGPRTRTKTSRRGLKVSSLSRSVEQVLVIWCGGGKSQVQIIEILLCFSLRV